MKTLFVMMAMIFGWNASATVNCFSEKDGHTLFVALGGADSAAKVADGKENVSFTKTPAPTHAGPQTYTDTGLSCVVDKDGQRLIGVLCTKTSDGAQVAHMLHPSQHSGKFTYQAQAIYPPGYEDRNIFLNIADDLSCTVSQ